MSELVVGVLSSIAGKKLERAPTRAMVRLVPVQLLVQPATLEAVVAALPSLVAGVLDDTAAPCTYCVEYRRHGGPTSGRREERDRYMGALTGVVAAKHTISFSQPEVCPVNCAVAMLATQLSVGHLAQVVLIVEGCGADGNCDSTLHVCITRQWARLRKVKQYLPNRCCTRCCSHPPVPDGAAAAVQHAGACDQRSPRNSWVIRLSRRTTEGGGAAGGAMHHNSSHFKPKSRLCDVAAGVGAG